METVNVNPVNGRYKIYIGDVMDMAGAEALKTGAERALIVTDSNVAPLFLSRVKSSLEKAEIECSAIVIPAGEKSKCEKELFAIYDAAIEGGITRRDVMIALGGGVVGDICGLAASTYMRGVPFVQIPTTLLAQVDSSVGGKVAIDLPKAKNAVGAFYQPVSVLADISALETLDERQTAAGMAEVIKYAAIADETLIPLIEARDFAAIVKRCCEIKTRYVEEDPFDKGRRMELNFGHTAGHGIETASGLTLLHGEGVAIGMIIAARAGERLGLTEKGVTEELMRLCGLFGLPTEMTGVSRSDVLAAMRMDKKSDGEKINVILIERMGKARAFRMTAEQLLGEGSFE